jgi:hypothetical protein
VDGVGEVAVVVVGKRECLESCSILPYSFPLYAKKQMK